MSDAAESAEIYQFRIVIRDRIPQLWRRVQFSRNVTLARFHLTFQTAFGWSRTGVPRSGWALGFRAAEVVAAAHRMM